MGLPEAAVLVVLFLCITAVLVTVVTSRSDAVKIKRPPVDPEQLLAERFARGEIDEREYGERLATLRMGPPLHTMLDR